MDDFSDRTGAALVVGASGGLGAGIARTLAERGSHLALTYRSRRDAVDALLADPAGRRVRAWQVDLGSATAVADCVAQAAAEFDGLHTVVHAAGPTVPQRHLSTVDAATFDGQLIDDVTGCFHVLSAALPHLRASHGNIVVVSTAATTRFPVRDGLSSVPKASVEALVRALAVEEGRFGVRANCVGPGMLTDGMAQALTASGDLDEVALDAARRAVPLRRFGSAGDIAEAVCFLASDRAGFISGQKLDVDGGYGA